MSCKGLHCEGCGKGAGIGGAVIALIVLAVIVGNGRAINHAIGHAVHELIMGLFILAIIAIIATAVPISIVFAITRNRNRQAVDSGMGKVRSGLGPAKGYTVTQIHDIPVSKIRIIPPDHPVKEIQANGRQNAIRDDGYQGADSDAYVPRNRGARPGRDVFRTH